MAVRIQEKLAASVRFLRLRQVRRHAPPVEKPLTSEEKVRETTFQFAVIALGAKLALVDGPVNGHEIERFRAIFHAPAGLCIRIGTIFADTCADGIGHEYYARRIARYFPDESIKLEEVIGKLLRLAEADDPANAREIEYIQQIADIFGLPRGYVITHLKKSYAAQAHNPYAVLGVSKKTGEKELKQQYRKAVQFCHPDSARQQGIPKEIRDLMCWRFQNITAAYQQVRRKI